MKLTRRQMLTRTAGAIALWQAPVYLNFGLGAAAEKAASGLKLPLPAEDLAFLRDLTRDVVQAARIKPGEKRGGSPANSTGCTLIMPGGNYPSYWIRDFAMALDSGFITEAEMWDHLKLAAQAQNGAEPRLLKNGLMVPPYAIPDHINFDGGAVFYPGTYSSGEDQGNGAFGFLPPVDDHYEFIHIAHRLWRRTGQAGFLRESIQGLSILERLRKAFAAPATDPATGLATTGDARRAVGFGFCDAIYFTGSLLFPSLLRHRAVGQLADLCRAAGQPGEAGQFTGLSQTIATHLAPVFGDGPRLGGWLMAATQVGRQADVWGTLYALHLGVLPGAEASRARQAVAKAFQAGTITLEAAVRHVPRDLDASPTTAWERAMCAHDTYQNGAYWHTPTGWLLEALAQVDTALARRLFDEYISHLKNGDFRKGGDHHAPWECFGAQGRAAQNAIYMTSVALPWSVIAGGAKG
jgi:hypothetical protein